MDSKRLEYQRRCAVSKAWANERQQVANSRGSRNWSQKDQREILATGKCHGYEGQHMLSVKAHPEHAGNEKNIQFLTRKEHFQAHGGNWKNDANGRYNLRTGKVEPFANGTPDVKYKKLSDPVGERSKKIANNRYQQAASAKKAEAAAKRAASREKLPVHKTSNVKAQNKQSQSRNLFNRKVSANQGQPAKPTQGKSPTQKGNTASKGKGQGM